VDWGEDFHAVFLDEKWFYLSSRRRKIKILPPGPGEDPDEVAPHMPTAISRRHALKVMVLGVVGKPHPDKGFDGRVLKKRVSKMEEYKKTVYSQNFTDDATANGLLKDGQWFDKEVGVVVEGMTLGDLKDAVAVQYFLDDDIRRRLVLKYHVSGNAKKKAKYIDKDDATIPTQDALALRGYTLVVKYKGRNKKSGEEGDKREVDVSCDSDFMTKVMPEVGQAIRSAYHWVLPRTPIFLYLDNAGGHGTQEAVDAYVKALKDDYNVICIHQRPRSPATNILDLGVWMYFQCIVEKEHFRLRKELSALCRTVDRAWDKLEAMKLENVYNRWKLVLDLIIEDGGGNGKVESKRGKLYREPSNEAENLAEEDPLEMDELVDDDADVE